MDVHISTAHSTPWGSPWGSPWSTELTYPPPANDNETSRSRPASPPKSIRIILRRSSSGSLSQHPVKPARAKPQGRRGERAVTRVSHLAILLYVYDCGIPKHPSARGLAKLSSDHATELGLENCDLLDPGNFTFRNIARDSLLALRAPKRQDSSRDDAQRARLPGHRGEMQALWSGQRAMVQRAGHLVILRYGHDCGIIDRLTPPDLVRLATDHASQFEIENSDLLDPDDPAYLDIARDSLMALRISDKPR
jgi:hypothetical protein